MNRALGTSWEITKDPWFVLSESQKERKRRETERTFEKLMAENVPNLRKDKDIQIKETQWTLSEIYYNQTLRGKEKKTC